MGAAHRNMVQRLERAEITSAKFRFGSVFDYIGSPNAPRDADRHPFTKKHRRLYGQVDWAP